MTAREDIGATCMTIVGADRFVVDTSAFVSGWTAEDCLKHLSECGFQHFVLALYPGFLWPGDMDHAGCAHFQRFLAGHRLRLVALSMSCHEAGIASPSAEMRAAALDGAEGAIGLGGAIAISEEIGAVDSVIAQELIDRAVKLVRARLERHQHRTGRGMVIDLDCLLRQTHLLEPSQQIPA